MHNGDAEKVAKIHTFIPVLPNKISKIYFHINIPKEQVGSLLSSSRDSTFLLTGVSYFSTDSSTFVSGLVKL